MSGSGTGTRARPGSVIAPAQSPLQQTMVSDLATFFNTAEFAQTIFYDSVVIPALVDYTAMPSSRDSVRYDASILVKTSDVPIPAYRKSVVIGAATWVTGQPEDCEGDGLTWKIPLSRDERRVVNR